MACAARLANSTRTQSTFDSSLAISDLPFGFDLERASPHTPPFLSPGEAFQYVPTTQNVFVFLFVHFAVSFIFKLVWASGGANTTSRPTAWLRQPRPSRPSPPCMSRPFWRS